MALPGDSHTSGAAGTVFPTQTVAGKEYPVGMFADQDGHIQGSLPAWGFVVPPVAVGASKIYFDLFNAQSATVLRLRKLFAIVANDVAVSGVVAVRLDVMRTSAVGTSGTAFAGPTSASKTAAAFWPFSRASSLPAGVTARVAPSGGATDQAWLFPSYIFTEETAPGAHLAQMFNLLPDMPMDQAIELDNGAGLKVVQGSVASVGSIGFFGTFTIES
ncbi:MAG: hypothetical protein JWM93_3964 [Frankiales bacterium]|nr:hypothetical protein [Frankiales bacterium]